MMEVINTCHGSVNRPLPDGFDPMKPTNRLLTLIRHAKSSWDDPDLNDILRPLNKRGRKNAPVMAQHCRTRIPRPNLIFCSDAQRTKETAIYFLDAWSLTDSSIRYRHDIYESSLNNLLQAFSEVDSEIRHLALIGHNPGITALFNYLAKDKKLDNIPTCGVAHLEFQSESWSNLPQGNARVPFYITPKSLE